MPAGHSRGPAMKKKTASKKAPAAGKAARQQQATQQAIVKQVGKLPGGQT